MQLTINGFHQEQLLGKFIRDQYIQKLKFLSEDYNENELLIVSSPTQRTIFSAAGFLNGLYPNYAIKNFYYPRKNIENFLEMEVKFLGSINLTNKNTEKVSINELQKEETLFAGIGTKENEAKNQNKFIINNILNLKNEDTFPQLHQFTELEKKATSFLKQEPTREIPLNIISPLDDRLFHPWKCNYQGKLMREYLKGLDPIFDLPEEEINKAYLDFKNFLRFSDDDMHNPKYKNNKDKLLALMKFYMSFKYHFKFEDYSDLSKDTCKTFKKFIINDWYSIINSKYNEELKIPISEFFDVILSHFKEGIENHKNSNSNKKYKKFKVYSGHDTILINILRSILDKSYIKDHLKKSLDDDNIFHFFIPEFASYMLFELYYDEKGKYYFVKIIYNGMNIYDGLKIFKITQDEDNYENEIRFERFEEIMKNIINKDYLKLECGNIGE